MRQSGTRRPSSQRTCRAGAGRRKDDICKDGEGGGTCRRIAGRRDAGTRGMQGRDGWDGMRGRCEDTRAWTRHVGRTTGVIC